MKVDLQANRQADRQAALQADPRAQRHGHARQPGLHDLRGLLEERTGLALSGADVERAVRERMRHTGIARREDYAAAPGTPEFAALVELVVVPESWMFRDPQVFDAALRFVQRRLAARPAGAGPLRILSLPCAGGEEPYSMAMALLQAGVDPTQCRIDAVDLSQAAIARAQEGRYTRNAFRTADLAFRERWFTRHGDEHLIAAAPRAFVDFRQGNLFALETGAGIRYDLVFCRNLLIYFNEARRAQAAQALHALLADDGLLLSGHAEAPAFCRHGFAPSSLDAAFALRKQDAQPRPGSPPAPAPARPRAPMPAAARSARHLPATSRQAASAAVPAPPASLPARPAAAAASGLRASPDAASARPLPSSSSAAPDAPALLAQAQRDADGGRLAQAEAACRAMLAATPDHAAAWFLLGMIAECRGDTGAADHCWRRCVYLDPGHYDALCSLALLHERLGDAGQGAAFRRRAGRIFARRARVVA